MQHFYVCPGPFLVNTALNKFEERSAVGVFFFLRRFLRATICHLLLVWIQCFYLKPRDLKSHLA